MRAEYAHVVKNMQKGNEYHLKRYASEKVHEQISFYKRSGWDIDAKLWLGGLWIIENSSLIAECWNSWWDQNIRFGVMDELSLPVMLANHGLCPQAFKCDPTGEGYIERIEHRMSV